MNKQGELKTWYGFLHAIIHKYRSTPGLPSYLCQEIPFSSECNLSFVCVNYNQSGPIKINMKIIKMTQSYVLYIGYPNIYWLL